MKQKKRESNDGMKFEGSPPPFWHKKGHFLVSKPHFLVLILAKPKHKGKKKFRASGTA